MSALLAFLVLVAAPAGFVVLRTLIARAPRVQEHARNSAELWDALAVAVQRGDRAELDRVCRANEQAIVDAFPSWAKRDPALGRPTRREIDQLVQVLGAVAEHMRDRLGRAEPWALLTAPPGGNPIDAWQRDLQRAQALEEADRHDDAVELLEALLERVRALEGTAADELAAVTHGRLGRALFHTGRVERAKAAFERALALSEANGDVDGRRAYHSSLFEVQRYLANAPEAARHAEALAQLLLDQGDVSRGAWYGQQAILVARGEAKNRIVVRVGERVFELENLPALERDVTYDFEYRRNRITLGAAALRVRAGSSLAERRELEEALSEWRAAAAIDPHDPQPHYESGVALLELGSLAGDRGEARYAEALAAFERTEELAPGWFLCRHYAWLARELVADRLGGWAVSAALAVRDDAPGTSEQQATIARDALARAPTFAWMHVALGRSLRRSGDARGAERALRAGLDATTEPCFQGDLLLELATLLKPGSDERDELLLRASRVDGTLMSSAAAHVIRKHA